jgi:GT2 family glycosyltransferase
MSGIGSSGVPNDSALNVAIPGFSEESYLASNPDAREAVEAGAVASAYQHFLRVGIDENRGPLLRRDSSVVEGAVERYFVSDSGYFLILGWLADEGRELPAFRLYGSDFNVELPNNIVLRHARRDVEVGVREGAYDYGFIIFGKSPSRTLLKQPVLVQANSITGSFQARATPDVISDKRLLDTVLTMVASGQSHAGMQANLYNFFASSAGDALVELFRAHVGANIAAHHVETFRPRPVTRSFISVLFGSTEAILLQPILFRQQNIDFGEWIYVCNSPEDASAVLRLSRLISDLYDVMITVVVMTDNVGFGAANNVAVGHASGQAIYVINPDVFPLAAHADVLRKTLNERALGANMWGGLLFYDDHNLMHSGMYLEQDSYFRCASMNKTFERDPASVFKLVRVEHFDKGVPFEEKRWKRPRIVPAISGALMAFDRAPFEKIGGFSTRYIYGHYEDADLSLRWAQENGPVVIDPGLRFVHLEGQGSRARGDQYRGAAMTNRYLFSLQHNRALAQNRALLAHTRDLDIPG